MVADIESIRKKLGSKEEASGELVLELKPVLTPAIVSMLIGLLILFVIVSLLVLGIGMEGPGLMLLFFLIFLPLILISLIPGTVQLLKLRTRRYNIYTDRVEWYEGFITIKKRMVYLNRVTDIFSRRGVMDRAFGTGTIGISTAGSHGPEVVMTYIRNMDDTYTRLRELWKARVRNNPPEF